MLYELALTPELFDKSNIEENELDYILLIGVLREAEANGIIANLDNNKWIGDVVNRIYVLSPKIKDEIIRRLNRLKDRKRIATYPSNEIDPTNDLEWLQHALKVHELTPFYSVISSLFDTENKEDPSLINLKKIMFSDTWNERRNSTQIKQSPEEYTKHLRPVMRHARKLQLIDPYMSPLESRYLKTLEICIRLLEKKAVIIHIHCKIPFQFEQGIRNNRVRARKYLDKWEIAIKEIIDRETERRDRYKIFIWQPRRQSHRFHDRFIITDQCGVGIQGGLDTYDFETMTNWNLITYEETETILNQFKEESSPYDLLGYRTIEYKNILN
ncbi:hypothetical protein C1N73_32610 (plasmid) [Priestia aryabhattai]